MCGIAGIYAASQPGLASPEAAARMCAALIHRGPDSQGIWADSDAGLVFGQRRLAVIDTSEAGLQPMESASGRFVINYNGEIFNYLDVRAELEAGGQAPNWRGHSDTETMLEAIDRWGLPETLRRIEGQFAIALWDRQARRLYLARDRFGEKPLYYGWAGKALAFGSELKALRILPGYGGEVDREALASFVRYGFVPHPRSIWRGISKLQPGTWTSFGPDDAPGSAPKIVSYWDAGEAATRAMANPWTSGEAEAVEALDALLARTVKSRMIADVPLGAMLSGGVDSSTVVAMMQAHGQAAGPVKTFTIGFEEAGYNEAEQAKAVAAHLGTDHTELYLTAADALAVVPRLPVLYDEPFADASQIPTHLVSGLARRHVTVALSGDAGDEIFGGYNRYFHGADIWKKAGGAPRPIRAAAAAALQAVSPDGWNRAAGALSAVLPAELSGGRAGEKIHKLAGVLSAADQDAYHQGLLSLWDDPAQVLTAAAQGLRLPGDHPVPPAITSFAERAMYLDTRYYLPDDILAKVDRAAMGVSLEARAPFLDREVFAFAWSLPMAMKISGGRGKQILRKVLDRYVPRPLIDRPKQGFALPIGHWLRGELKDWGAALLAPDRLKAQGLFDPVAVRRCWDEHQMGKRNWDTRLWVLLMAQAWLDEQARPA
jgi:asparagine synthase (glutamine-hydrolysing)